MFLFFKHWIKAYCTNNCWSGAARMNGVERQNNTLKHSYLHQHKTNSLTGMLTVAVEDILPENRKGNIISSLFDLFILDIFQQYLCSPLRNDC